MRLIFLYSYATKSFLSIKPFDHRRCCEMTRRLYAVCYDRFFFILRAIGLPGDSKHKRKDQGRDDALFGSV